MECKTDEILELSLPVDFYQPGYYTENDGVAGVRVLDPLLVPIHFSISPFQLARCIVQRIMFVSSDQKV